MGVDDLLEWPLDDEGYRTEWTLKELTREAQLFEGIILTVDGGRHDIPMGGGIKRTSSAIGMSGWLPDMPPRSGKMSALDYTLYRYMMPQITDTIHRENLLMQNLRLFGRKPPARQAVWTERGWKMEPVNRKYAQQQ